MFPFVFDSDKSVVDIVVDVVVDVVVDEILNHISTKRDDSQSGSIVRFSAALVSVFIFFSCQ